MDPCKCCADNKHWCRGTCTDKEKYILLRCNGTITDIDINKNGIRREKRWKKKKKAGF